MVNPNLPKLDKIISQIESSNRGLLYMCLLPESVVCNAICCDNAPEHELFFNVARQSVLV